MAKNIQISSRITDSKWLMHEPDLRQMLIKSASLSVDDVNKLISADKSVYSPEVTYFASSDINLDRVPSQLEMITPNKAAMSMEAFINVNGDSEMAIAVISIKGVMMPEENIWMWYFGGTGMKETGNLIQSLDNNPMIEAIVLHIDSPGGTLSGTENLGRIVKNTKKPIVAYADNNVHSAAYWVASQCDYIIANGLTTSMGSVGVVLTHTDYSKYYENFGLNISHIVAPQSKNKVIAPDTKPVSDEDRKYLENILRKDADVFIKTVRKGRGEKIDMEAVSDASVFNGNSTLVVGLHDGFSKKGIEDAIIKARELAQSNNDNVNTKRTMSNNYKNLKISGKENKFASLATGEQLILVKKSELEALNESCDGLDLSGLSEVQINEQDYKKLNFDSLGIKGSKASAINVIKFGSNGVLVEKSELSKLDLVMKALSSSEDNENQEVESEDEQQEESLNVDLDTTVENEAENISDEEEGNEDEQEDVSEVIEENSDSEDTTEDDTTNASSEIDAILARLKALEAKNASVTSENEKLSKELSQQKTINSKIKENVKKINDEKGIQIQVPIESKETQSPEVKIHSSEDAKAVSAVHRAKEILLERKQVLNTVYQKDSSKNTTLN